VRAAIQSISRREVPEGRVEISLSSKELENSLKNGYENDFPFIVDNGREESQKN
jgi:hypothetical protein